MSRLDVSSLSRLSRALRDLPKSLGIDIARRAAPVISEFARESFETSADPYGVPWAPGAEGQKVTLRKTGDLKSYIRYVAIGAKLRVALGVPYAKYQIGRRAVYPQQAGALPKKYVAALEEIVADEIRDRIITGGR